ncbi:MAG: DUF5715 family protein [Bacteroidota bacterium]
MNAWTPNAHNVLLVVALLFWTSCATAPPAEVEDPLAVMQERIGAVLEAELARMDADADAIARVLKDQPLLRGSQESQMRRQGAAHMTPARRLGITPNADDAQIDNLLATGALVPIVKDTTFWIVRDLDYSVPYVVPSKKAMLVELGQRFHARLATDGLPPIRFEITSLLRTAETQAALRRVNTNAARGTSAHEFGTTVDLAYSSFAAPAAPYVPDISAADRWLEPYLQQVATAITESTVAKYSREMQALLGEVLLEMQREGKVVVLLERRQPVYHITVADDYGL